MVFIGLKQRVRPVLLLIILGLWVQVLSASEENLVVRVASFNVSMESSNYGKADADGLMKVLHTADCEQVKNIAEILQITRPNVVLLNEFDFIADPGLGVMAFLSNYLRVGQKGNSPINYPYFYSADVNTGHVFPVDLNGDGRVGLPHDAFGWGHYPGHYGMLLLSQFPIDTDSTRTYKDFLWKDMPGALLPEAAPGKMFYSKEQLKYFRLSSKSHWDIPIRVNGQRIHILASHPTPPVFDGPEDRNGRRNFDEIRFWKDYINSEPYIYSDQGKPGKLGRESSFIILGDLNASDIGGDGVDGAIRQLLDHPRVHNVMPVSIGAKERWPGDLAKYRATHDTGLRLDYVLPSTNLEVTDTGVYWPSSKTDVARLVKQREAGSDHRMVWVDIQL